MIYVIAKSVLKPGRLEDFTSLYRANLATVLAEAGCISYTLCRDAGDAADPNTVTFVECWESTEHLKAHLASPHMKKFMAAAAELRTGSSLSVVTPV